MAFVTRLPVRLDDVDFAQVLYYPRYVHFFCVALEELFKDKMGLPWPEMFTRDKLAMPTVDLQVTYRRPMRYGDEADIAVSVKELAPRKAVYAFEMRNSRTGEVACTATQTAVFVSTETWEAIPIPQPYRRALEGELDAATAG